MSTQDKLREVLDGLAFAAHQAGEQGRQLGDAAEVGEWIAAAIAALRARVGESK